MEQYLEKVCAVRVIAESDIVQEFLTDCADDQVSDCFCPNRYRLSTLGMIRNGFASFRSGRTAEGRLESVAADPRGRLGGRVQNVRHAGRVQRRRREDGNGQAEHSLFRHLRDRRVQLR